MLHLGTTEVFEKFPKKGWKVQQAAKRKQWIRKEEERKGMKASSE